MISSSLLAGLSRAINYYLHLDADSHCLLKPLAGKVVAVRVKPMFILFFIIDADHIELVPNRPPHVDCEINGFLPSLLHLALTKQAVPLASSGVTVVGDMDVAEHWGALFKRLDIDWEEYLAKIVGDPLAYGAGSFVRNVLRWLHHLGDTLTVNIQEYVQEEIRYFPGRLEVEDFLGAVDDLANRVDRLSARIERLHTRKDKP